LKEKDKLTAEKDEQLKEKDKVLQWTVAEKDKLTAEKDERLKEKDELLHRTVAEKDKLTAEKDELVRESADRVTALYEVAVNPGAPTWQRGEYPSLFRSFLPSQHFASGSVTRAEEWTSLHNEKRVTKQPPLPQQKHLKRNKLMSQLNQLNPTQWTEEKQMYTPVVDSLRSGFYPPKSAVCVINSHANPLFPADISFARFSDAKFLHFLLYFLELKLHSKGNLTSPANCGQILNYFHIAHEKQPHRKSFTGILSDIAHTYVFTARYDTDKVNILYRCVSSLADAIIFADDQSQEQNKAQVPQLPKPFGFDFAVLAAAKHHFILDVPIPKLPNQEAAPTARRRGRIKQSIDQQWQPPSRHLRNKSFIVKIAQNDSTVANELEILRKLKEVQCVHLPELVWAPEGNKQLGLVPVGKPIDFQQTGVLSQNIVRGLVDGLQHLHKLDIVHRDIRPSNLVLQGSNVIIIDYETSAILNDDDAEVQYFGGFIAWPKRLLETGIKYYRPEPADDLLACILVVLHLLFPSFFHRFHASSIGVGPQRTPETQRLLTLWGNIERSRIWGPFVKAAKGQEYEQLKGMADVFCHI